MSSVNMKNFHGKVCPFLVVKLIMTALAVQGVGAHTCGSTFFSALVQLIPCRASVAPFSPIPPSDACCNAIKTLGQSCLCILVNGPPISGVDRSMAMQLPDKCSTNFDPCELSVDITTKNNRYRGQMMFSITTDLLRRSLISVNIVKKAVSTLIASSADVSIKKRFSLSANSLASSVGTALRELKSDLFPTSMITMFLSA
ncbi:hypothetical protein V2J09_023282 [Rumex salicifolius]